MSHTLISIEKAINSGDFHEASRLLKKNASTLDSLNIKTKEGAEYIRDYIKTYFPEFSISKSPLIKSLSDFLDIKLVKDLLLLSRDINTLDAQEKVDALYCFLDNKKSKEFYSDHKCLKKILGEADQTHKSKDTIAILSAHTKCEPGLKCGELKDYFTILYNLHPIVAKVMDVSAKACSKDKCHIVFTNDPHYSSKNNTTPDIITAGYYDGGSDIFVSSKRGTLEYYGTFIHELTHYAMNSMYKYHSNPYPNAVSKISSHLNGLKYLSNQDDYKKMVGEVDVLLKSHYPDDKDQSTIQNTIKGLKSWYEPYEYDCELVVRYPHLVASGYEGEDINGYLKPLENYYQSHLIPDMDNYLVA